ncbi:hypothetical protein JB92DRAFT_2937096, partial [Gautieria morchelliformis]
MICVSLFSHSHLGLQLVFALRELLRSPPRNAHRASHQHLVPPCLSPNPPSLTHTSHAQCINPPHSRYVLMCSTSTNL